MVSRSRGAGAKVPACETPGKPSLLTVTQATDATDRPGGRARGVRDPRQVRRGVALCTAVVVVGITIAISGGGRGVRADTGSAQGSVSGTGAFFDGTVTQTVTVSADTSNLGTFSISDGTSSSIGDVTCLFISGSGAVFGAHLNFGPGSDLYGLIFITDGGPAGPDTLGLSDTSLSGQPIARQRRQPAARCQRAISPSSYSRSGLRPRARSRLPAKHRQKADRFRADRFQRTGPQWTAAEWTAAERTARRADRRPPGVRWQQRPDRRFSPAGRYPSEFVRRHVADAGHVRIGRPGSRPRLRHR